MTIGFVWDDTKGQYVLKDQSESVLMEVGSGKFGMFGVSTAQDAHIGDSTASHADATTFANVTTFLNAFSAKVNDILVTLENYGLLKKS